MRFVTFVKSNAKALLTLRIKSPLRSAEGTTRDLLANPVLMFAHIFTNIAYCARSQHALPRAYLDAGHRDGEFSLSAERRHFGLRKSKIVKHRIVFLHAHCGTQRIAGALQHAFYVDNILTRSDISLCNEH